MSNWSEANDINDVFRADQEVEVQHRNKKGRSEAEEVMEAIMINKFQEGSEAYLMMKREDDVVRAWSQAYRWFVEVTGAGMHQLVQDIMFPKGAQKDEDVLRIVEAWMDDYREAICRAMNEMDDVFRITI